MNKVNLNGFIDKVMSREAKSGEVIYTFVLSIPKEKREQKEGEKYDRVICTKFSPNASEIKALEGKFVAVDGRLSVTSYENDKGEKKTSRKVVADHIEAPSVFTARNVVSLDGPITKVFQRKLIKTKKGSERLVLTFGIKASNKRGNRTQTTYPIVKVFSSEKYCEGLEEGELVSFTGRISSFSYEKDGEKFFGEDIIGSFSRSRKKDEKKEDKSSSSGEKSGLYTETLPFDI